MNAPLPVTAPTRPPQVSSAALHQAGRNGLFRLLRSLLRENIFQWQATALSLSLSDGRAELLLDRPAFDSLGGLQGFATLSWQGPHEQHQIGDPVTALADILAVTDSRFDTAWQRIAAELKNSMENEALTISWRQQQHQRIRRQCQQRGFTNLLQWSRSQAARGNSAIVLEQWAATGHPYHPGSKTKLGLSADEVWQYSPEFSPAVPLVLIAVHRTLLKVTTLCPELDYRRWFQGHYPDWYQDWLQQFSAVNTDAYLPVPVHPWQLRHTLAELFAAEISQRKVLLDGPHFLATPTLSCRTLAPGLDPEQPYIKLPVAAQMTSSVRNLSAASVDNAPLIGSLLQDILLSRPDIAAVLRCQWDEVGLHSCVDHGSRDVDRCLSAIFRRNPARLLQADEHAVVIAALFTPTPTSDAPLFIELMRVAGVTGQQQALHWFDHYVDTLLRALLSLFLDYGLALEAHQQNMMAIFDSDARLQGFINRDVGGICIHRPTLAASGWPVNFTASAVLVASLDEARQNFSHAVLQSHVGELVTLLDGYFGLSAAQLWQAVSLRLQQQLKDFGQTQGDAAYQREMQAFFQQPWPGTAFLRMRRQDQSHHAQSQPIANPLANTVVR